jgi:hypothetical protein
MHSATRGAILPTWAVLSTHDAQVPSAGPQLGSEAPGVCSLQLTDPLALQHPALNTRLALPSICAHMLQEGLAAYPVAASPVMCCRPAASVVCAISTEVICICPVWQAVAIQTVHCR